MRCGHATMLAKLLHPEIVRRVDHRCGGWGGSTSTLGPAGIELIASRTMGWWPCPADMAGWKRCRNDSALFAPLAPFFDPRPSIDSHRPSSVCTLLATATVGVEVRVPGPAVTVGERGGDHAPHVDLSDPLRARPGEQGVLLDERQRVLHCGLVGSFDRGSHRSGRRSPTRSTPT